MVEAIQAGDREALRRLYEQYSRYAMGVSLRIVTVRNWVAKITTNRALDWMREHDRLQFADQLPDETVEEEDETPLEEVPPDILSGMIGRLPRTSRIIVNLHAFGQMSHKEIARQLGIHEKTSMSQFSRAKRLLAMMMKEYLNSQRI